MKIRLHYFHARKELGELGKKLKFWASLGLLHKHRGMLFLALWINPVKLFSDTHWTFSSDYSGFSEAVHRGSPFSHTRTTVCNLRLDYWPYLWGNGIQQGLWYQAAPLECHHWMSFSIFIEFLLFLLPSSHSSILTLSVPHLSSACFSVPYPCLLHLLILSLFLLTIFHISLLIQPHRLLTKNLSSLSSVVTTLNPA